MESSAFRLISFSGIDGAGKSTQIDALCRHLEDQGYRLRLYTFWDDVVAFSSVRERLSLRIFKGDKGIGSPDRPIVRRDKNVTSWHVVLFRFLLYFFDALRLAMVVSKCAKGNTDVLILDRYIYDELANLPLQSWPVQAYVRLLLRLAPTPDVAFLLDADPEAAVIRKPEYPVEFVRRNREAYLAISRMAGITVLPPSSIVETGEAIRKTVSACFSDSAVRAEFPIRQSAPAGGAKTQSG